MNNTNGVTIEVERPTKKRKLKRKVSELDPIAAKVEFYSIQMQHFLRMTA
jgi:hypothetical protein